MLNLNEFQTIFNENDTGLRCRHVLDNISPKISPIFKKFVHRLDIELGETYVIKSYDSTLRTTYADSQNPKYTEKNRNSNIGRRYRIQLHRKVKDELYNLLTLELDGMNRVLDMFIHVNFNPFWTWIKNNEINHVLEAIPSTCSIFTDRDERTKVEKEDLIPYIKDSIKKRRPWFQIGTSIALEGELSEQSLINHLSETWRSLERFRHFWEQEIDVSSRAYEVLMKLAEPREIYQTELLGRKYRLEISALEKYKTAGKVQHFQLFDDSQMITKGSIRYVRYYERHSPLETIAVILEGHNHIFTNSRTVLGEGIEEWWITKVFATHNLDNQEVMANAMALLQQHGIQAMGSKYCVGSYNNETETFVEGAEQVKRHFINAALLFAHASERLSLPTGDGTDDTDAPEDGTTTQLEPNFRFEAIYDIISSSHFTFSIDIIRDLHLNLTALEDKHFVVLSGISGTGKTQICRLYANAVYELDYESDNPYLTIIPVRPDWMDAAALFGYYSSFEKRYMKTEFLNVVLNALKEREKPHFVLLDEMNLARVEYYMSDYLSAVESGKEIHLHQDETITDVPQKLMIPPNVYILGTINVDETTHSISDKVLDRAFVMTLSDVDFDAFWERVDQDIRITLSREFQLLRELHEMLAKFELHFGYRTLDEVLRKLYANHQLSEQYQMHVLEALDRTISEKVLPKIRGDERISGLLDEVGIWLKEHLQTESVSYSHVKRMQEELAYYGATEFWS